MELLSNLLTPGATKAPKTTSMIINGIEVPVTLRRNRNARRYILRLDKSGTGIVVTLPTRGSQRQAMEFAASHSRWIEEQLASAADHIPLTDGSLIPLRGTDHRIVHRPDCRGTVWIAADGSREIHVAGHREHVPRRTRDWLKRQAKDDLLTASGLYAGKMGLKFSRVTVRDQTTRWGSCSAAGALSYSWRLILAPPYVLDYVAAHEVAHLQEMNHGPRFWSLVRTHCPRASDARRWLKVHGRNLHRYG